MEIGNIKESTKFYRICKAMEILKVGYMDHVN